MDAARRGSKEQAISIHAPHEGERQGFDDSNLTRYGISIHAPHEGERLVHFYVKRV